MDIQEQKQRLWETATDEDTHPALRKEARQELARIAGARLPFSEGGAAARQDIRRRLGLGDG